jgi:hypothetical protein
MQPKQSFLLQQLEKPFWQLYLIVIAIDTLFVLLGSLLLGNIWQMSNLYFISTLIFLIIAALPIFFEIGASAKIVGKAIKNGEEAGSQFKEKKKTFDQGARITYLFGLSGITTFLLAILSLGIR